jgi:hypothetical protein
MRQPPPHAEPQPSLYMLGRDVGDALRQGHYLQAIKLLRQQPGMDLKRAKDIIDAAHKQLTAQGNAPAPAKPLPDAPLAARSDLAPGEVPHGASLGDWILVAAAAAIVAWYLLRGAP